MFTSGEKTFNIFDVFFIIILLLSITQIIISVILRNQVNSKLEHYYYSIEKVENIPISTVDSIKFHKIKLGTQYNPYNTYLGLTGDLILDCYNGYCIEEKTEIRYNRDCTTIDDYEYCDEEPYEYEYEESTLDSKCSYECFESKGSKCNQCPSSKYTKSKCLFRTNDKYYNKNYCLSNNIIYYWKGEIYRPFKREYTYLENAILKNEECPISTKYCGIIDDNENKLCIKNYLNCPINVISEEKLGNSNSSFQVGNKTFYYYFDENAKNKKIIEGLFVDTDIYKKEEDYFILDTYTISGLLEENERLYKGVNLGFDPYTDKDIDKKGKSYLKIKYNNKNVDLISLREKYNSFNKKSKIQENLIRPVTDNFEMSNMLGIIGYSLLILLIVILMTISFCNKSAKDDNSKLSTNQCRFLCCFIPVAFIFYSITIFTTIKYCSIVGKLNEIDKELSISSLKICNIIYIILSFLMYAIILILVVFVCIYRKIKKDSLNKQTEKTNVSDNTFTNIATDSNTDKKI